MVRSSRFLLLAAALWLAPLAKAADTPDPLRFYPSIVDLVVKVENPRSGLEAFRSLKVWSEAQKLDATKELFERPDVRRFFRLVEFYEKELGTKWPQMLDEVAGGGISIATKLLGDNNAPFTIVVQGRDEKAVTKFKGLFLSVIEAEYTKEDVKSPITTEMIGDAKVHKLGGDSYLAQSGAALLLSNNGTAMKLCLEQGTKANGSILDSDKLKAAKKLHVGEPIAWLWFNLDTVKAQPDVKELFKSPRNDVVQTILFSGYLNVFRQSSFLTVHLRKSEKGFVAALSLPAGKEGANPDFALHVPVADVPATLPLLNPKGTLFSHSFYYDLATLWNDRDKLFTPVNAKAFEEGGKNLSKVLPQASLGKLLQGSGLYHRVVIANIPTQGYTRKPDNKFPAGAFVMSMRDEDFGPSVNSIIRGAGFLVSTNVKLKLFEETFEGVKMLGYRFPETGDFPNDPTNLRFNFMPTFAIVGDQYIAASNKEICRAVITELKKPVPTVLPADNPNMRMKLSFDNGADLLALDPAALLTQAILGAATTEAEAKKQVEAGLKLLRDLGSLTLKTEYKRDRFDFNFIWDFNE